MTNNKHHNWIKTTQTTASSQNMLKQNKYKLSFAAHIPNDYSAAAGYSDNEGTKIGKHGYEFIGNLNDIITKLNKVSQTHQFSYINIDKLDTSGNLIDIVFSAHNIDRYGNALTQLTVSINKVGISPAEPFFNQLTTTKTYVDPDNVSYEEDYASYRRTVSRGKSLADNDLFIDFDDALTEENMWEEPVVLAEDAHDIKSLIKKVPNVKTNQTPLTVTLDNYKDSVKVKCVKCGAICIDDTSLVEVPAELCAHDTAFGWYCDKCHNDQSDYEWDVEAFRDLCNAKGFGFKARFSDLEYMDDVEIDNLASMINSWNRAKKDPKCRYSSNPQEVREMEQDFITGAKKFGLDIDSNVFKK